jgi:phenylpyruvate tautomerase PptA (4-oxalocrotonate tautomerase family)
MPVLNVFSSAEPPAPEAADVLLRDLSRRLAERLGKSESWVMTCLMPQTRMTFGGTDAPACYVEIKNLGKLSADTTQAISAELCDRLSTALGVPSGRIYIEFQESVPHLWGHDGETFA